MLIGAALAALAFIAASAFLLGMYSAGQNAPPAPVSAAKPASAEAPKAPPAVPVVPVVKAPAQPVKPAIYLAAVTEGDRKKVGMGCMCTFSKTQRSENLLIAGGDDFAIWRPNGDRKICPLQDGQLQELFDDDATIQCGSSRVVIKGRGKVDPGFDGHGRAADLTVFEDGEETTLKGRWLCGC